MSPRTTFLTELSIASRKMRTMFDAAVRARGLTLPRARLMLHLSREDGATQTELASLMELEQPTLARLLDGMQKAGLVERHPVPGDRRARRITLTPGAAARVEELEVLSGTMEALLLKGVPEAEVAIARSVLARFTRAIEAQSPARLLEEAAREPRP